jgi:regulator of protease activity HflC (stomatin/prohibitin superfamily)
MTKDNVTLNLTSVIYYQIISPHKAAFGIANVRQALIERTQTTLRHVIGARVLQDVIERREEIAQSTSEIIEEVAAGWGVLVVHHERLSQPFYTPVARRGVPCRC